MAYLRGGYALYKCRNCYRTFTVNILVDYVTNAGLRQAYMRERALADHECYSDAVSQSYGVGDIQGFVSEKSPKT